MKLAKNRSPRWAFWDWFEVPNYDNPAETYLRRLRIIQTPWFGVMLHFIYQADPRWTLHDHPWNFLSIVLRGMYIEDRLPPGGYLQAHVVKRFNFMRLGTCHSIRYVRDPKAVTLVLHGRRRVAWSYREPIDGHYPPVDGLSWFDTKNTRFDQHRHNDEFLAAMKQREEMGLCLN